MIDVFLCKNKNVRYHVCKNLCMCIKIYDIMPIVCAAGSITTRSKILELKPLPKAANFVPIFNQ